MTTLESSRLDKMDEKLEELAQSIDEIKKALLGSDFTNGKGLIHNQADVDRRLINLERLVWMGSGVAATIAVIYAIVSLMK